METFKQSGLYTGKLPGGNQRFTDTNLIVIMEMN